ncbi:MAG: type II toxin-antitoxin system VapC family toxin [Planctomycetota bacterium]|jgi:PIN domain nuclease of toxin-antitoxin system
MRILLDTHVFIWWITDAPRLSPRAREALADPRNALVWSAASSWEIAIKAALGRIEMPEPIGAFLGEQLRHQRVDPLPVEHSHAWRVADLPLHHRDPFDRMLVAQALVENLPILTADRRLEPYGVETIW